ncbi:hypothetical protein PENSPDRAFT_731735 [Peniophora sp. CONT]|nr:hypothetical protein PENSPDRAFT_731735 [Peniophora sp. CONT]
MSLATARSAVRRAVTHPKQAPLRSASTNAPTSSSAPSTQPPRFALPAEKLRQLISLYHQSRDFVTRENLERKIDQAFVETPAALINASLDHRKSYPDLINDVGRRRLQPAVRPMASVTQAQSIRQNIPRGEAVYEALYGTSNGRNAGLELVLETWGTTSKRLEELQEDKATSAPVPRGRSKPVPRRS